MTRTALYTILALLTPSLASAGGAPAQVEVPPAVEIRRPAPPADGRQAAMRAWHSEYAREMKPVRRSLARLLRKLAAGQGTGLGPVCRRLDAELAEVDLDAVLPVPDFATNVHLSRALGGLYRAATACLVRRPGELIHHLDEAGAAFGNAALALRRYGLRP